MERGRIVKMERKQEKFWAITGQNTIREVTGLECAGDWWWVPELGSMAEGVSLFPTRDMATARLKGNLRAQISKLEQRLADLE